MTSFFDEVARALGSGVTRRQALRRVTGLFAGAALGALGLAGRASADTLNNCNTYCKKYVVAKDFMACRTTCLACSSTTQLCGTTASSLACCTGVQTCCSNTCTNTQTDTNNCGGCGKPCLPGQTCTAGTCVTPPCGGSGQSCCSSGPACNGGLTCCSSTCRDTTSDPNNCGACGTNCLGGDCVSSVCCGATGQPCCFDVLCNPSLVCSGGTCVCGNLNQPCCDFAFCNNNFLTCSSGTCVSCGSKNQPCCSDIPCNTGLTCTSGTCQ